MNITLTIQLFTTLALLAIGFWSRRKDRQQISKLASELATCRSALHEFMQETEATFAVFSRLVHKTEPSPSGRTAPAAPKPAAENGRGRSRAVAAGAKPAPAVPPAGAAGKKTQVLKLADQGLAVAEIASQLTIPQGEIDLILNLNRKAARC
jgi:type II secretory pathway pseudopilin PulG